MDLHVTAQPNAEEQAAVDSVLGAAPDAPERVHGNGAGSGFGLKAVRSRRQLLLPVLHAIQSQIGWISLGALSYACRRLSVPPAEAYGVASFYGMFSLEPRPPKVLHVCDDIACMARGADALCEGFAERIGPAGTRDGTGFVWLRSPCLGLCERAPAALLTESGREPREKVIAPADFEQVDRARSVSISGPPDELRIPVSVPQAGQPGLRLLRRIGRVDPGSLAGYREDGGYEALRKALSMSPRGVVEEMLASRLLGRGGAAFPAGKKWEALEKKRKPGRTHYLVVNADESEPGTFKDRVLMEGDPFSLLEAMTIAGYAIGAERAFFYVRGEYPLAAERMAHAISEARSSGLLGNDILGRGLRFDVELRRGAGAYICGEETALFNSIEGYRGEPRNKPPFPTEAGLFGEPTVVNNVETLANVPWIIREGGAAFARIGTEKSTGTKLFCLSGHVARPGVYEVPFGATVRDLLDLAGGVTGRLRAVLLGGAAGALVGPDEIDAPFTFEGARQIGATLGSAVVMPLNDTADLGRTLSRIAAFFRDESCGQCVPCRVGTVRQQEALERLSAKRPLDSIEQELALIAEVGQAMRDASICGLGQTASSVVESALKRWRVFS